MPSLTTIIDATVTEQTELDLSAHMDEAFASDQDDPLREVLVGKSGETPDALDSQGTGSADDVEEGEVVVTGDHSIAIGHEVDGGTILVVGYDAVKQAPPRQAPTRKERPI